MRTWIAQVAGVALMAGILLFAGWSARGIYEHRRQASETFAAPQPVPPPPRGSRAAPADLSQLHPGAVVCSKREIHPGQESRKYHLPDCRIAKQIKRQYLIYFDTPALARENGYQSCSYCRPDQPRATTQEDKDNPKTGS